MNHGNNNNVDPTGHVDHRSQTEIITQATLNRHFIASGGWGFWAHLYLVLTRSLSMFRRQGLPRYRSSIEHADLPTHRHGVQYSWSDNQCWRRPRRVLLDKQRASRKGNITPDRHNSDK
ncbi:hypothetical protein BO79DRAFT_218762 [Aspergillus costaricaensis CBS 115574]|uniref:Uncharacterized protein n=1 Tax=Aspergillus costaricaensis CBS 115574 TaxID=1448317 RepID=A0ACD1ICQ5_9EURO|nr:hypothetical protein BO79DRAFT_218762 [Aspergillus costaricaensis CBS 115574]RAK87556.1 hypothetical protein BO79DRAFT_218762 [Aspergillus costaricaensis CBS 115574]